MFYLDEKPEVFEDEDKDADKENKDKSHENKDKSGMLKYLGTLLCV